MCYLIVSVDQASGHCLPQSFLPDLTKLQSICPSKLESIKGLIWERVAPCWAKIISFFLAVGHRLSLVPCHMTLSTWMLTLGQFV